jgi:Protein of unknown function (DUF3667)
MVGDIEAAADALTGGLVARAVEPGAGEASKAGDGPCLNCGTSLAGAHCHACGQKAKVHRTLGAFGHDILHSIFHFEGKIWRTLPLLFWKPGELTRRYVHGERARFVSPLALFLFSVFLMFAVFGRLGGLEDVASKAKPQTRAEAKAEIAKNVEEADAEIARLAAERAALVKRNEPTGEIDGELVGARAARKGLGVVESFAGEGSNGFTFSFDPGRKAVHADTGWSALDQAFEHANRNPELMLYKIQSSAYKFSWALIPLSLPFVWLLFFWRREFHLYDHAVFVTYSLCFMTLWVVLVAVFGSIGLMAGPVTVLMALVPPLHMYRQMKGAYGLSSRNALLRTSILLFFTLIVLTLFVALLMLLGVMG